MAGIFAVIVVLEQNYLSHSALMMTGIGSYDDLYHQLISRMLFRRNKRSLLMIRTVDIAHDDACH
jgi:hypothetical protein